MFVRKKLSEKVTLLKCISVLCRNVLHGDRAVGTVPSSANFDRKISKTCYIKLSSITACPLEFLEIPTALGQTYSI